MPYSLDAVLQSLKAVAEPTRLRLLALLSEGELTVSEICEVLGQSQPRVSRHLRVLTEAGLLDRFREEHWVYYRVPARGGGAGLAGRLLDLLPGRDPILALDRERRERVIAARLQARAATDGPVDTSEAVPLPELGPILLGEIGPAGAGDLLDIGTGAGNLLRAIAPAASRAVGIDVSTDALRLARTHLHVAGLGRCEVRRGDMYQIEFADASFDTVTFDRVLAEAVDPVAALREAARVLGPGGRVLTVEDFDALSVRGGNPLSLLRDWFRAAGLLCLRLRPVDTVAGHLLIAVGSVDRAADAAA